MEAAEDPSSAQARPAAGKVWTAGDLSNPASNFDCVTQLSVFVMGFADFDAVIARVVASSCVCCRLYCEIGTSSYNFDIGNKQRC